MPRRARNAPGGLVYHVLNRANGRLRLFKKAEDFLAFERTLSMWIKRLRNLPNLTGDGAKDKKCSGPEGIRTPDPRRVKAMS